MEEEGDLNKLKERYSFFRKKYSLPSFDELNIDFHIEKICDEETDFLIREIRRYVSDKVTSYTKLIESLLHPVNSSIFIFSIIKVLGENEKKDLHEIYNELAKFQIKIIKLDTRYSEESEADFIKNFYNIWKDYKDKIYDLFSLVEKNFGNNVEINNKGYFG